MENNSIHPSWSKSIIIWYSLKQTKTFNSVLLTFKQIKKCQVDQYVPGSRVPSCQLYAKWTGRQGQPVELTHRVELLGAKDPCSYFLIRPPTLQSSLQG